MRWAGHLTRMDGVRLPKQIFYGELLSGKRPPHKPKKRFKDVVKHNLKALEIDGSNWETLSENRSVWRKLIFDGCKAFEQRRIEHSISKRALRKQDTSAIPEGLQSDHLCNVCGRVCLSKAGLVSHLKSHGGNQSQSDYPGILPPPEPAHNRCQVCDKVCKSAAGLKNHMRTHKDTANVITIQRNAFSCHLCNKVCKSEAGLKSHLRAHGRVLNT